MIRCSSFAPVVGVRVGKCVAYRCAVRCNSCLVSMCARFGMPRRPSSVVDNQGCECLQKKVSMPQPVNTLDLVHTSTRAAYPSGVHVHVHVLCSFVVHMNM